MPIAVLLPKLSAVARGHCSSPPKPRGREEETVESMALTRDFKLSVVERVERDLAFAQALLDEAATLFFNGEPGGRRG